MSKWKCEICEKEFDNFHAQRFEHKIYCPLCFFKEKTNRLEKENALLKEVIEEVKDRITIKLGRYINEKDYVIDDVALDELLQILENKEVSE